MTTTPRNPHRQPSSLFHPRPSKRNTKAEMRMAQNTLEAVITEAFTPEVWAMPM